VRTRMNACLAISDKALTVSVLLVREASLTGSRDTFIFAGQPQSSANPSYSTVTDFARFRGLSTSVPRAQAV